jgi:hypothetical protein
LAAWWLLREGADVRKVIGWSVVPGIVAFLALVVVLRVKDQGSKVEAKPRAIDEESPSMAPRPSTLDSRPAFWAPILALTALAFFRLPETLLILRLQDRGLAVALVPLIWAGLHVVRSATSYPGGWLSDRLGPRQVVAAGGLVFALVAYGLGRAVGPGTAIALFLLLGLVAGLTESGERAMVARLAPVRTGRGFGVYHALTGAAALPAGLIFGALYQRTGGPGALWLSAGGMVAAVVWWMIVSGQGELS